MQTLSELFGSRPHRGTMRFMVLMLAADCALLTVAITLGALGQPELLEAGLRAFKAVAPFLGAANAVLPIAWALDQRRDG